MILSNVDHLGTSPLPNLHLVNQHIANVCVKPVNHASYLYQKESEEVTLILNIANCGVGVRIQELLPLYVCHICKTLTRY